VQHPLGIAQLVDMDAAAIEGVLHPRRRLGAVADRDHHRRCAALLAAPGLECLPPVIAQQVVGVQHQVGQRLLGLGPAVQVVLDVRVTVDVVQAALVGFGVRHGIVADHHARRFHQAGLDGVVQAKVAHNPAEQRFLAGLLARRRERRSRKVITRLDPARALQPVATAHPHGGLFGRVLQVALAQVLAFRLPVGTPGVVRLVVDHHQVAGIGHGAQHLAGVGLVGQGAALVHAAPPPDLLAGLPGEAMPVDHEDAPLAQAVGEPWGQDTEGVVIVPVGAGLEDSEPLAHGKPRGHHQHVPRKARVLRVSHLVQHLPGDEHGHHDGLARTGGHLAAQPGERTPVPLQGQAHPVGGGALRQPDQRLDRLHLAEEEAALVELLRVLPVLQQAAGDARDAGVAGLSPGLHPRADLVHEGDLAEDARVIKGLRGARGDHVARWPPPLHEVEQLGRRVVTPVAHRLLIGRVDDQAVDGGAAHQSTPRTTRLSMPRSSTILTATRRCSPGAKGSDTVPR